MNLVPAAATPLKTAAGAGVHAPKTAAAEVSPATTQAPPATTGNHRANTAQEWGSLKNQAGFSTDFIFFFSL